MEIDFLKPARMDDVLDVVPWPVAVKGASIILAQEVRRGAEVLVQGTSACRLHQRGTGARSRYRCALLLKADLAERLNPV